VEHVYGCFEAAGLDLVSRFGFGDGASGELGRWGSGWGQREVAYVGELKERSERHWAWAGWRPPPCRCCVGTEGRVVALYLLLGFVDDIVVALFETQSRRKALR